MHYLNHKRVLSPPTYWKNWKNWYKLLSGIAVMGVLLAIYIAGIIDVDHTGNDVLKWFNSLNKSITEDQLISELDWNFGGSAKLDWISIVPVVEYIPAGDGAFYVIVNNLSISYGFGEYTIFYACFFTNISNILIGVWFLWAAIRPKKEGNSYFLGYSNTLIISTYIALTMLIFTTLLVPSAFIDNLNITWDLILTGVFQHLVFPILFLVYICLFFKPRWTKRNTMYMKKEWWKLIIWLLVYLAFVLIRGEIRYRGKRPVSTQYPYFFLRIHDSKINGMPGWTWLIVAVIAIIGICFGISILINTLLNHRIKRQVIKLI